MKNTLSTITFNVKPIVRHDEMEGKEYLVVPCVMMVEGVHNGSGGAIYYPAKELAKTPQVWNHKPVVVYHPNSGTACDPIVLSSRKIGIIMNAIWDDGKLKAEAWLDPDRIEKVDNRIAEAIENQTMMELSTGLYLDLEAEEGTWNGEDYVGIARNYRPDHLAILPDIKGACSMDDGAGFLRLNSATPLITDQTAKDYAGIFDVLGLVSNELSHDEIREQLHGEVNTASDPESYNYVVEVYEDEFVYETSNHLYKRGYNVTDNKVTLIGLPMEVVRKVTFTEVTNEIKKGKNMDKKEFVNGLIENKVTTWTEEDRETLMGMDESVLNKMVPVEVKKEEKTEVQNAAEEGAKDIQPKPVEKEATSAKMTKEEFMNSAPDDVRQAWQYGVDVMNAEKTKLVEVILANEKNVFEKEYLNTKDVAELKAIASLAAPAVAENQGDERFNYAGQGNPAQVENTEEGLALPVMEFTSK